MNAPNLESQSCRHLIDRLRAIGLDKHIDLPQVAVMGDTSSGKSSVLTALSGIEFPSSEKLTTRCPTQLILSDAESFSATINLQRHDSESSKPIEEVRVSDISEITEVIQRFTQILIDEGQCISDDSIIIKASGPNLPNLTLTDLPGLVRTVSDSEDEEIITRVRALVDRYLNQKRTVILAVIPANVDIHNNEILTDAQRVDPDGLRTLGIITKPDLVDEGAEDSVLDLLQNRTKELKLGYHVVKGRGQKDLNNKRTIAHGIAKESEFFETHPAWKSMDRSLVGINQLASKLVALLEDVVIAALPDVMKEIDQRTEECYMELSKLGEPLENSNMRRNYHSKVCGSVVEIVRTACSGQYGHSEFSSFFASPKAGTDTRLRSILRLEDLQFQIRIKATKKTDSFQQRSVAAIKAGDLVEYVKDQSWSTDRKRVTSIDRLQQANCHDGTVYASSSVRLPKALNLDDIKQCISENRGDELPIFPSYAIFCTLVSNQVAEWNGPMNDLLAFYLGQLRSLSKYILDYLQLSKKVHAHFSSSLNCILIELEKKTQILLNGAMVTESIPFTLNHYLYEILIKLRNEPIEKSLRSLGDANGNISISTVRILLKSHGVGTDSNEDREAKEMHMALAAYMKVARKRFVDTVPSILNTTLVLPLVNALKNSLSLNDEELEGLLAEKPSVITERKKLRIRLNELKNAKKEVDMLG